MSKQEILKVAVLAGDGIGPEVIKQANKILRILESKLNIKLNLNEFPVGGAGYEATGHPLPDETMDGARKANAVLLGAVGGPKWESLPPKEQPERAALLPLRKEFELFANLRPGNLFPELADLSPLRQDVASAGIDVLCVRELTGGIYFGQPKSTRILEDGQKEAIDTMIYRKIGRAHV